MIINNNITLLNIYNNSICANKSKAKAMEKISSGIRINTAGDDSANMAIDNKMRAQILGIRQAGRNIQDGISLIQVADGALAEIGDGYLQRIRELFVYASNSTLSDEDKNKLQKEIEEMKGAIAEVASNTEFNNIKLLDGSHIKKISSSSGVSGSYNYEQALSLAGAVDSSGKLTLKTNLGYPTTNKDDNQRLVYGTGNTSIPKIRIDGTIYNLRDGVITPTVLEGSTYKTVYSFSSSNVKVTQYVGIVKDKYEIKYNIDNTDSVGHNVGFQFNIDAQLGTDDYAPFIVNGSILTNETSYTGAIPDSFIVYNQGTGIGVNAEFQAMGILKTKGDFNVINPPDKLMVGRYNNVTNWDYTPAFPPGAIGDSGYSLLWNPRTISSGGSFQFNTFYGMSVPPTIADPTENAKDGGYELLIQVGSNEGNIFNLDLCDARLSKLGIDDLSINSTIDGINKIDKAIENISTQRSKLGAYQNALQFIGDKQNRYDSDITSAESRINDSDIASETIKLAKYSILQECAVTLQAQARQLPQKVLSLLNEER